MTSAVSRRNIGTFVLAGTLLLASEANASSTGAPTGLRLFPLARTPSLTQTTRRGAADARAQPLAAALRQALDRIRDRGHARARARLAAGSLGDEDIEVRWRPGVDTPMQIRGDVLQPAVGGGATLADAGETARAFLRARRDLLRLDDPDAELVERRREDDALGRSHFWFSQRYRGLPVWPADLAVHLDRHGNVDLMNGAYVPTPRSLPLAAAITAPSAVEIARREVPLGDGAEATPPELIVYAPGERTPRLAWRLELSASLAHRWLVLVDAHDGAPLATLDLVAEANVESTGVGVFGEALPLNVFEEGGQFFLADTSKQMFDPTSDPPSPETTRGAIIILDAANREPDRLLRVATEQVTSDTADGFDVADGVSAAFGLSETYDYYLERHGRDALDGERGTILAIVRFDRDFFNAFWNGTLMVFGDALPFAGALDVVGHELTHGVTQFTANLVYRDQPGALNEAFSDIFGEMVEARTRGTPDWVKGGELGEPLQNYADPGSLEIIPGSGRTYPAGLSELLRPDDPLLGSLQGRDNGGVHINSSILNHAYYLLAEGLPGALGLGDAERIFYRALSVHLVTNSQFIDARLAAITSAEELFGAGSPQALKTAEAFDAVEIFDDVPPPRPTPIPSVDAADSTLFVFFDESGDALLGRREQGLGDEAEGVQLSTAPVAFARPSVSGDGSIAAFVDAQNDVCLIETDGGADETCVGFPGFVGAVSMAPDGNRFGFVLLDESGDPLNEITVIDIGAKDPRTFTLVSPELDGGGLNSVLFADAMDFSADGRLLVYDALNSLRLLDGSTSEVWSIYALDIETGTTHTLVPPMPGVDIGFPVLSQTSDSFIAFDVVALKTEESTVMAGNLLTGEMKTVATVQGFGAPSYAGDDRAIIYTGEDPDAASGASLFRQPLADDRITPQGEPSLWLSDGFLGTIYRRGEFTPPSPPGECVGDCSANGVVTVNEIITGVSVALERTPLSTCAVFDANGDGEVSVDELIAAVGDALRGC